jgi:ABC-type enterochelin transport system permease subunit
MLTYGRHNVSLVWLVSIFISISTALTREQSNAG